MRFFRKFEKVTPEMIKECTDDLEFYDKNGYFPWENKIIIWFKKKWNMKKQKKR